MNFVTTYGKCFPPKLSKKLASNHFLPTQKNILAPVMVNHVLQIKKLL